jgi:putative endonuclease
MSYFIYLLRCKDGSLYCGYTNNLIKRIHEHNHSKLGAKYTKNRRPVELVYYEEFDTQSKALKREKEIKKLGKISKEKLVKSSIQTLQ